MTGNDFIAFAIRLNNGGTPIECRTAVGRAYYGAFHVAMELLAETGIQLPAGPEAHQKLRFCLLQSGEPHGIHAGEWLESLRKQRNFADYDLKVKSVETRGHVEVQVRRSQSIVAALDACCQEPVYSRFRANVRAYAAKILRLPVAD